MFKKLWAWLKGLFVKGKTEMNDIANVASTAIADGKADLETAASALQSAVTDAGGAVDAVTEGVKTEATAVLSDLDALASKIKATCDKLGIELPPQWAQVIELIKVL